MVSISPRSPHIPRRRPIVGYRTTDHNRAVRPHGEIHRVLFSGQSYNKSHHSSDSSSVFSCQPQLSVQKGTALCSMLGFTAFSNARRAVEAEGVLIGGWSLRRAMWPKTKDGVHGELTVKSTVKIPRILIASQIAVKTE